MVARAPDTARQFFGRASLAAATVLVVPLLMLTLGVRQTTRPLSLLAKDVARFGDDLGAKEQLRTRPARRGKVARGRASNSGRARNLCTSPCE